MTTHEAVRTIGSYKRYWAATDVFLKHSLFSYLPRHLIKDHGLVVGSVDYTTQMYAHELALGENDSDLLEVLTRIQNEKPEATGDSGKVSRT